MSVIDCELSPLKKNFPSFLNQRRQRRSLADAAGQLLQRFPQQQEEVTETSNPNLRVTHKSVEYSS